MELVISGRVMCSSYSLTLRCGASVQRAISKNVMDVWVDLAFLKAFFIR